MADPEVLLALGEIAAAARAGGGGGAGSGGGTPRAEDYVNADSTGNVLTQDDSAIKAALDGVAGQIVAAATQIAIKIAQKLAEEAASGAKTVIDKEFMEPWKQTKQWADESGQAGILRTRKEISQYYQRVKALGHIRSTNLEMADLNGSYMPTQVIKESYKVGRAGVWALGGAPGMKDIMEHTLNEIFHSGGE